MPKLAFASFPTQVSSDFWYLSGTLGCYFWTAVSPLARTPAKVYGHTMTLLHNSILVFGGFIQEAFKGSKLTFPDVWRIDAQMTSTNWEQYRSIVYSTKSQSLVILLLH